MKSTERHKRRLALRRTEETNIVVPLSGVKLELNVGEDDLISAITVHKWITSAGSFTKYARQSEILKNEEQTRNLSEEEFILRSIDTAISACRWKTVSKENDQEVNVRRLLDLALVAIARYRAEASLIEGHIVGYRRSEI